MSKCVKCEGTFQWDEKVILVNDESYCNGCVTLYPSGYVAFSGDEFLGETENDDGQDACELFPELLDED